MSLAATLRALPKVELHRHLEGALRIETLWEFHEAAGARVHASREALRRALVVDAAAPPDFRAYLARFAALRFRYGGPEALERIGREAVADAAGEGVAHLELRLAPLFWAARLREQPPVANLAQLPLPPLEDLELACEALARGADAEAARRGLSLAFILCLNRQLAPEANVLQADLLGRPAGAAFAAVDVCGDEAVPLEAVGAALARGLRARPATLHAGEDPAARGAANVREAVERFGARRIGHGVRAVEDPAVLELLRAKTATLEVCPTSNIQTAAAPSFEAHPLRALVEAGVRVTLNTDNPTLSAVTLTDEYLRAHERCGLTRAQLREVAVASAEAAFLPDAPRRVLVARVAAAWAKFV
ncbi:MAG: adenosine deaminase family protein [Planctomycetota bacterium]|nr:adenosine deaminase family protein [Planctomycetota bacterium]